MKNEQSLHNWQFQSLIFQKLSNLVPGCSKNLKKSPKVLLNHKMTYLALWYKVSQNCKFSPWTLKNDKNGPWDIKTLRKTNFVLVLLIYGRNGPWLEIFGEITKLVPEVWWFGRFGPWGFISGKINKGFMYYWKLAENSLMRTLGEWQNRSLKFQEITKLVYVQSYNQTGPLIIIKPKPNPIHSKHTPSPLPFILAQTTKDHPHPV